MNHQLSTQLAADRARDLRRPAPLMPTVISRLLAARGR